MAFSPTGDRETLALSFILLLFKAAQVMVEGEELRDRVGESTPSKACPLDSSTHLTWDLSVFSFYPKFCVE